MSIATGLLTISSAGPVGTNEIIIYGSLPNYQKLSVLFTVTGIANSAPIFSSSLSDQTVSWKSTDCYQLPTYSDSQGNTITLSTVELGKTSLPTFVSFNSATRTYFISPSSVSQIGTYSIQVTLSDSVLTSSYQFSIAVTNTAPTIGSQTAVDQIVSINQIVQYTLPSPYDADSDPITTSFSVTPSASFVSLSSSGILQFGPTLISDMGTYIITITLSDTIQSSTYNF